MEAGGPVGGDLEDGTEDAEVAAHQGHIVAGHLKGCLLPDQVVRRGELHVLDGAGGVEARHTTDVDGTRQQACGAVGVLRSLGGEQSPVPGINQRDEADPRCGGERELVALRTGRGADRFRGVHNLRDERARRWRSPGPHQWAWPRFPWRG